MSREIIQKLTLCEKGKEEENILAIICTGSGHKATRADVANIQKYIPGMLADELVASLPFDDGDGVCSKRFTSSVSSYLDRVDECLAIGEEFEVNKHAKFVKSKEDQVSECSIDNLLDYQYARVGDACLEISTDLAEKLISTTSVIANISLDFLPRLFGMLSDPNVKSESLLGLFGLDFQTPLNTLQKRIFGGILPLPVENSDDLSNILEYFIVIQDEWEKLNERVDGGEKVALAAKFVTADMSKGETKSPSFSREALSFSSRGYLLEMYPKSVQPEADALYKCYFCRMGWSKLGLPA